MYISNLCHFFCYWLFTSQTIACAIVIGIFIHAGTHLACDFPRIINSSTEDFALIASDFGNTRPTYKGLLSGVEGVTGIAMVVLMAISFTLATRGFRRNLVKLPAPFNRLTGFNAFWYSHHLLGLVYILLIVHGTCLFLAHKWDQKTVRNFGIWLSFYELWQKKFACIGTDCFANFYRHGCTSLFHCCST